MVNSLKQQLTELTRIGDRFSARWQSIPSLNLPIAKHETSKLGSSFAARDHYSRQLRLAGSE
jgi:hypothetical protein